MLNLEKYSFNEYSENYRKQFYREKLKLTKILPKSKIEHVGSSSIKGLGGKGIIDIVISVPKYEIQKATNKLHKEGYDLCLSGGDKDRKFFQKIVNYNGKKRRVHLHLTNTNSKTWRSMISVRDYLRNNAEARREYTKIKKEAVKYAKGNAEKYRDYKKKFLQKIEGLAFTSKI